MRDRARELDVCHALAANLGLGDLYTALLTHDTAVLQALVFAAQALVVLDRAEDLGAKKTITLRLERAVVDRLRLFDLTERPRPHHVRRCQADANCIEVINRVLVLEKLQQIFH